MKKIIKVAIFTFVLTLAANISFAQNPTTDEGWFRLGIQQHNQSKFSDAVNSFSQCIKISPAADVCYLNRGISYHKLEKFQEAFNDYSSLIKLKPNDAIAHYQRGLANFKLNKYYQSEVDYSKAIELKPDYAAAYTNRAYIHYVLQKKSEAILDYSKAIEIEPQKSVKIYIARGLLYCGEGYITLAQADEKKAIALGGKIVQACVAKPNQKMSPCGCGDLEIVGPKTTTRSGDTMTFYARLPKELFQTYEWEVDKGTIIKGQGTWEITVSTEGLSNESVVATVKTASNCLICKHTQSGTGIVSGNPLATKSDEFDLFADKNPKFRLDMFAIKLLEKDSSKGYILTSGTKEQLVKTEEYIRSYLLTRRVQPDQLIFINKGAGSPITQFWVVPPGADFDLDTTPEKSVGLFDPASLGFLDPTRFLPTKTADEWVDLGVQQYKEKKLTQALASYKKAIELNPKLARGYNNIGIVYKDQGQIGLAIQNYSKAIELKPDLYQAFYNRAIALQKQKKTTDALTDASRAIWIAPKIAAYYLLRAELNCESGFTSVARSDEQDAIKLGGKVLNPCVAK